MPIDLADFNVMVCRRQWRLVLDDIVFADGIIGLGWLKIAGAFIRCLGTNIISV